MDMSENGTDDAALALPGCDAARAARAAKLGAVTEGINRITNMAPLSWLELVCIRMTKSNPRH